VPATLHQLREAIGGLRQELAAERLYRARNPGYRGWVEQSQRARYVCSQEALEALQEITEDRLLPPDEVPWLRRQLAAARYALQVRDASKRLRESLGGLTLPGGQPLALPAELARLSRGQDALARRQLGDALERALRPAALRLVADHAQAAAQSDALLAEAPATPKARRGGGLVLSLAEAFAPEPGESEGAKTPEAPWLARARAFIKDSEAAAQESVRYLTGERSARRAIAWHALWYGLRAPELDAPNLAPERFRRAATTFRALGFESHMGACMRAEPERGVATPLAKVIALQVPHDVRVAQSVIDYGVLSDIAAAGGVGEALALSLALPALPVEMRLPGDGGAAEAVGVLATQLWGDRPYLMRMQGLGEHAAERVGRLAAVAALLWARLAAALATVSFAGADSPERRLEVLADAVSRALCCEVPGAIAGLLGADRRVQGRARGALAGLAMHVALRERYDEDWYRNPRVGERLRSLLSRGNRIDAETLCAELGSEEAGSATARLHELLA